MPVPKTPNLGRRLAQLLGQIPQSFGIPVALARGKTPVIAEEAKLKRYPDPARPVELADEHRVVEVQAPDLDE